MNINKIKILFIIKITIASAVCNSQYTHRSNDQEVIQNNSISINHTNINNLSLVWSFFDKNNFQKNNTQQSPVYFTGDYLITTSFEGQIIGIDPINGRELFREKVFNPVARRGMLVNGDYIYIPSGKGIALFSIKDRKIIRYIGKEKTVIVSPKIYENYLHVAYYDGTIEKINRDFPNKSIWSINLSIKNSKPRVWSGFSLDSNTGWLYINTSNPGDLIGVGRNALDSDFSSSVIAIDSDGNIRWQHQDVKFDLWDLDVVGQPYLIDSVYGINKNALVALTKTGNIIYLDKGTGSTIFPNSIIYKEFKKSDIKNVNNSKFQKIYLKPEPFGKIDLDLKNDLRENIDTYKIRDAITGEFIPPSLSKDLIMYGLHGGANWPGGVLDYSKNGNISIILHSNKIPWIIRLRKRDQLIRTINYLSEKVGKKNNIISMWDLPKDADISKVLYEKINPYTNLNYKLYCQNCHGVDLSGDYENESVGDKFIPSLVGITLEKKYSSGIESLENFKNIKSHTNVSKQIDNNILEKLKEYFTKRDKIFDAIGLIHPQGFWQLLLAKDGLPASKPPWGELISVNLNSGMINWRIPNGYRMSENVKYEGDVSFGGSLMLDTGNNGIIFTTGTPDEMIYAYDKKNGNKLWSKKLTSSGSAPPTYYKFKGCDYITVVSSGGRFVGYRNTPVNIQTFKLKNCINEK